MNSHEIEHNVKRIFENFSKEDFLFDLLLAYGISKTSITRLKSGDFNLSKTDGEILYKKKIFFKRQPTDKLLSSIESLAKEERILKHSPRFAVVTDYKNLVAKDLKLRKNLDVSIKELPNHYAFFLPLAGSEVYHSTNDNEADRNAAYKMAQLYDLLITHNPIVYNSKESIHNLNIFLSRLLFCFFAEDTEFFDGDSIFTNTLYQHTVGWNIWQGDSVIGYTIKQVQDALVGEKTLYGWRDNLKEDTNNATENHVNEVFDHYW